MIEIDLEYFKFEKFLNLRGFPFRVVGFSIIYPFSKVLWKLFRERRMSFVFVRKFKSFWRYFKLEKFLNFHFEFLFALKLEMEFRKRIVSVVKEMIEILEYFKFEKSLKLHEFLFVLKSKIMKRSCRIMKILWSFGCEIIENFGIF